ncbi:MAG: aminoglycoside phosphotransferase family protein [Anaerolineaceae bacterium]|nr:aminoglycoside phosphotransferase family protein [Anaerolineaceae bacterium]
MEKKIEAILSHYDFGSPVISCEQFGEGHINWTYRIETKDGGLFVLQRINTYVFRDPVGLMRNIELITDFMRRKETDPRKVLELVPTLDNKIFVVTDDDEYWRVYVFVRDCICYDKAETEDIFCDTGRAFGQFQNLLSDFPVSSLIETIPDFHNTVARYKALEMAVERDVVGRAAGAEREIDYALSQKPFASFLLDKVASGEIPLRVTHNDTKINNVLFDRVTRKPLCVVDLDTTMPGIPAMDFGDSIRYAGNNAAEDEKDLDKVFLRMDLFRAFANGFCGVSRKNLSRSELIICPEASKLDTLEIGVRFLTDYLEGDVYFHTAYSEHNLTRARVQFALARDMDLKMNEMRSVIASILEQ